MITAPICLYLAYYFVYAQKLYSAEVAFNSFRIEYQIFVFAVLFMFSKRLLTLTIQDMTKRASKPDIPMLAVLSAASSNKSDATNIDSGAEVIELEIHGGNTGSRSRSVSKTSGNDKMVLPSTNAKFMRTPSNTPLTQSNHSNSDNRKHDRQYQNGRFPKVTNRSHSKIHNQTINFLDVTTRNAILVLTISIFVLMVTLAFTAFRFVFLPQTRLTLLIPMNAAVIDSMVTSICVICLFRVGDNMYHRICNPCHNCFRHCCVNIAKKTLLDGK